MYNGSILKVLERELVPVDRILQRWAVAIGNGIPTEAWDDRRKAMPPPLPDDLAMIVDREVLHAPGRTKRIIFAWYKTPVPVSELAKNLSMSRQNLYLAWRLSLNFMRYRFEQTGNKGLAKILDAEIC